MHGCLPGCWRDVRKPVAEEPAVLGTTRGLATAASGGAAPGYRRLRLGCRLTNPCRESAPIFATQIPGRRAASRRSSYARPGRETSTGAGSACPPLQPATTDRDSIRLRGSGSAGLPASRPARGDSEYGYRMFSARVPALRANRVAEELGRLRSAGRRFDDLTVSNPTRVDLPYPRDLGSRPWPRRTPWPTTRLRSGWRLRATRWRRISPSGASGSVPTGSFSPPAPARRTACCSRCSAIRPTSSSSRSPSYPLFEHLTRLDGVAARPYRLEYHGRWEIDVDGLARLIDARTRAVLLV